MIAASSCYVYRHIRKDNNEVFYIGIGLNDNNYKFPRAYEKRKRSKFWNNIIKNTDYEVEIMLKDLTKEEVCEKEREFIKLYGRRDLKMGTLVNLTDGGDGQINMSQIVKDKISDSLTGKSLKEETKIKIKQKVKNTWNSDEMADKRQIQRDRAYEMLKSGKFGSKGKPSKKKGKPFTGDKNKISESLKLYFKNNVNKNIKNEKVCQYDLNDNFIRTWESHHDAAKELNCLAKRILSVCRGKNKTCKKFKWKFYES